jgi:hypothetical protein
MRIAAGLIGLGAVLYPGAAQACSCIKRDDVAALASGVSVFFYGRAVEMRVRGDRRIYQFEVAGLKGVLPVRVEVMTHRDSATCGATFEMNQPVLVGGSLREGRVTTNLCTQVNVGRLQPQIEQMLKRCAPFASCP